MKEIGIRELKAHASALVQKVAEERASYVITRRGRPLGILAPADSAYTAQTVSGTAAWDSFFAQADAIAAAGKSSRKSAVAELSRSRR